MTTTPSFGLDHLVVLVEDLDVAAAAYEAIGFTVAPQMYHPFGTANRIIMFDGNFIELVGVVDREALEGPGLLIDEILKSSGRGAHGIALKSDSLSRDRDSLIQKGFTPGDVGGGARDVPLPAGYTGTARFSTAMIPAPSEIPVLWFLAQQHVPEVVWIPEWQVHENGAMALEAIIIEMADPETARPFLSGLFGKDRVNTSPDHIVAHTPRGRIELIAMPDAAAQITGVTIAVPDLDQAADAIGADLCRHAGQDRLIVPARAAENLRLEFIRVL